MKDINFPFAYDTETGKIVEKVHIKSTGELEEKPKWYTWSRDIGWKPYQWFFWKIWTRIRFFFTGECGNMCEYVESYKQFVPEAECPIHDK